MEKTKVKKVLTRTANILAVIIGVFVLFIAVAAISSMSKGYTSLFGYSLYAVKSNSMEGDNPDSFNKGDLILVKLINSEQQSELKVGDVITFFDMLDTDGDGVSKRELNTHRIKSITTIGSVIQITTKGDNSPNLDAPIDLGSEDIVGVYSSKIAGLGNLILFIQSPTGFLVTVVVPSILVVIYCAYLLFKNFKSYNKEKRAADLENMRAEIIKDMQGKESDK